PFRGPPRYNPRRRSGLGWGSTLSRIYGGPPSPCPSEHPFSSASSSLSEGSSHRSHEDDISFVTDKSLGDTSDIISDSSGVGTNSDSAACSIGHPSTTVVCMEGYDAGLSGHIHIQPGDVIEVVGSTDCGLLEGFVRGTNKTGFFPASCVQEVQFRQKSIINVSTSTPHHHYLINTSSNEIVSHDLQKKLHQQQQQHHHHQQQQQPSLLEQQQHTQQQYNSQTAPRMKKSIIGEPRTVVLHRAKRGFGFILRGAKASSPLMQLKPSPRCPALQYLDDVDPGGVADMSGLKPGDFLLAINSEDVTCASHEHVVDLIRNSGSLVSMTVVTLSQNLINSMMLEASEIGSQHSSGSGVSTPISSRQCSTLPRRMNSGLPGNNSKQPAPMPPRRDPKTTLSVGRARAKSMVAGLEGGGEKGADDDELLSATKSTSAESIHQAQAQLLQAQQCHSAIGTPTQAGPGTPVQPRTASIKSRPTSSRITAAELEELFQRQQGADANRCSMLMSSSRFQSTGFDSGAGTPPISPQKGPIVYASVAEMKRKKSSKVGAGTLKGRPIPIPQVGSDLKRTFHSTPDLASMSSSNQNGGTLSLHYGNSSGTGSQLAINANGWYNTVGHKGHRSQDDMHSLHMSLQRLNLPPPNHPPPPPPVGQVVKVDVSRGSEYECLTALRKHIAQKAKVQSQVQEAEVLSSFKPASNAKLYASPQDIRNVGYRTVNVAGVNASPSLTGSTSAMAAGNNSASSSTSNGSNTNSNAELCKTGSLRSNASSTISINSSNVTGSINNVTTVTISGNGNGNVAANSTSLHQYAQPGRPGSDSQQQVAQPQALYKSPPNSAPPLPEPDYSLSESDPDEDNSVRLVRTHTKMNEDLRTTQNPGMAAETSGNSNTSGSSTGSSSMPHSFSVDEIQKIRTKLKSSKSYPNDFLRQLNSQPSQPGVEHQASGGVLHEEGDNSSSGVSSDQEITITCNETIKPSKSSFPKQMVGTTALNTNVTTSSPAVVGTGASGMNESKKVTLQLAASDTETKLKHNNNLFELRSDAEDNDDANQDDNDSPSPPATGFQRHNSLTRKQAATIAANRAKTNQQNLQHRHAVSLATLPPPIEAADSDEADSWSHPLQSASGDSAAQLVEGTGMVVLAPPPEFSDSTVSHITPTGHISSGVSVQPHYSHQHHQHHQHQHVHHHHPHTGGSGSFGLSGHNPNCKRVRIVGAVPKVNRMNSQ
uniref:PDZ domain-containing protein n=1 Tax=Anopheles christyi TaxID=43041 RepID=A0A182KB42_9DIPT